MRTLVFAFTVAMLSARLAAAAPKLTLDETIAKALAGPRARMARGEIDMAEGRLSEAKALRFPRVKGTLFGTASPEIRCLDSQCTETDPQNFGFRYKGVWGGALFDVTQP